MVSRTRDGTGVDNGVINDNNGVRNGVINDGQRLLRMKELLLMKKRIHRMKSSSTKISIRTK